MWKKEEILNLIKNEAPTQYESNYCEWIVKYTPFIDEKILNENLKNSQKNVENKYQLEKSNLKWIEIPALQAVIQNHIKNGCKYNKNGLKFEQNIFLRKHFVKMMVAAEKKGLLEKLKNDI